LSTLKKFLMAVLALAAVFLAGYAPPKLALRRAQGEISSLRYAARLARLRSQAALVYYETSRKNYGLASEHASRYYEELGQVSSAAPDQQPFQELLNLRDAVTSGLARGDGSVLPAVEKLFQETWRQTAGPTSSPPPAR
jgi:hypothetical protein